MVRSHWVQFFMISGSAFVGNKCPLLCQYCPLTRHRNCGKDSLLSLRALVTKLREWNCENIGVRILNQIISPTPFKNEDGKQFYLYECPQKMNFPSRWYYMSCFTTIIGKWIPFCVIDNLLTSNTLMTKYMDSNLEGYWIGWVNQLRKDWFLQSACYIALST